MKEQVVLQNLAQECQSKQNQITEKYKKNQRSKAAEAAKEASSKRQEKNQDTLKLYTSLLATTAPPLERNPESLLETNQQQFVQALKNCTLVSTATNTTTKTTAPTTAPTTTSNTPPLPYADTAGTVLSLWQYLTGYGKLFNVDLRLHKININATRILPTNLAKNSTKDEIIKYPTEVMIDIKNVTLPNGIPIVPMNWNEMLESDSDEEGDDGGDGEIGTGTHWCNTSTNDWNSKLVPNCGGESLNWKHLLSILMHPKNPLTSMIDLIWIEEIHVRMLRPIVNALFTKLASNKTVMDSAWWLSMKERELNVSTWQEICIGWLNSLHYQEETAMDRDNNTISEGGSFGVYDQKRQQLVCEATMECWETAPGRRTRRIDTSLMEKRKEKRKKFKEKNETQDGIKMETNVAAAVALEVVVPTYKITELTCDGCGIDCIADSYLVNDAEDFCPKCYTNGLYVGGEHQKNGLLYTPPNYIHEEHVVIPEDTYKQERENDQKVMSSLTSIHTMMAQVVGLKHTINDNMVAISQDTFQSSIDGIENQTSLKYKKKKKNKRDNIIDEDGDTTMQHSLSSSNGMQDMRQDNAEEDEEDDEKDLDDIVLPKRNLFKPRIKSRVITNRGIKEIKLESGGNSVSPSEATQNQRVDQLNAMQLTLHLAHRLETCEYCDLTGEERVQLLHLLCIESSKLEIIQKYMKNKEKISERLQAKIDTRERHRIAEVLHLASSWHKTVEQTDKATNGSWSKRALRKKEMEIKEQEKKKARKETAALGETTGTTGTAGTAGTAGTSGATTTSTTTATATTTSLTGVEATVTNTAISSSSISSASPSSSSIASSSSTSTSSSSSSSSSSVSSIPSHTTNSAITFAKYLNHGRPMTKREKRRAITNFMRERGPTPCCNSYITFMKEQHKSAKDEFNKANSVMNQNYPSEMWRDMNEIEKEPWIQRAMLDKERYENELLLFKKKELNAFLQLLPKDEQLADEGNDEDTYDVYAEEVERYNLLHEQQQQDTRDVVPMTAVPAVETSNYSPAPLSAALLAVPVVLVVPVVPVVENGIGGKRKREEDGNTTHEDDFETKKNRIENFNTTTTSSSSYQANDMIQVQPSAPQQNNNPSSITSELIPLLSSTSSTSSEDYSARSVQYDAQLRLYRLTYKHLGLKYFVAYTKSMEDGNALYDRVKGQFQQQDELYRKNIIDRPVAPQPVSPQQQQQQQQQPVVSEVPLLQRISDMQKASVSSSTSSSSGVSSVLTGDSERPSKQAKISNNHNSIATTTNTTTSTDNSNYSRSITVKSVHVPTSMKKMLATAKKLRVEARQTMNKASIAINNIRRSVDSNVPHVPLDSIGRKLPTRSYQEPKQFDPDLLVNLSKLYDQRTNVLYCLYMRMKNGLRDGLIGRDRYYRRYYIMGGNWSRLIIEDIDTGVSDSQCGNNSRSSGGSSSSGGGNQIPSWYIVETPSALKMILACLDEKGEKEGKLYALIVSVQSLLLRTMKKIQSSKLLKQLSIASNNTINTINTNNSNLNTSSATGPSLELYGMSGIFGALCPLLFVNGGERVIDVTATTSIDGRSSTNKKGNKKDTKKKEMNEQEDDANWNLFTNDTSSDVFRNASIDILEKVSSTLSTPPSLSSSSSSSSSTSSSTTVTTRTSPYEHRILALRLLLHEIMTLLKPSDFNLNHINLSTNSNTNGNTDNSSSSSKLNGRSYYLSIQLLLQHAEQMVHKTLRNNVEKKSNERSERTPVYPLACIQVILENSISNTIMPQWWIESYRPEK